jgi:hypothetical protein
MAGPEDWVQWNRPRGGFFITLNLPIVFGAEELRQCAEKYGVIVTPVSFFSLTGNRQSQIRLSFSCLKRKTSPREWSDQGNSFEMYFAAVLMRSLPRLAADKKPLPALQQICIVS